jgi:predicted nucleic acid-binding protein
VKYQVCVDASLALKWLMPSQQDLSADSLLENWDQTGVEIVGPPLLNSEVTSAIRRNVYMGKLQPRQGEAAYQCFCELNVKIISSAVLTQIAWGLAKKYNRPRTYEMQYLALAELLDCEFWTADKILVNSLKSQNKRVHWIGEKID